MGEPSADGAVDEDDQEQKLTVTDALAELQNQIRRFQEQVDICDGERLGRLERGNADLKRGLVFVAKQNMREYPSFQCLSASAFPCLTEPNSGRHGDDHGKFLQEL
jgi:hypothetical protein